MANIKPFKGYFYNASKVGDISSIIAPTRYNISDEARNMLYDMNKYNAVRIFDGRAAEGDTEASNKYTRAATYLKEWIDAEIIVQDSEEAIYLYEETVEIHGNSYKNMTFVALLEIEDLVRGADIHMCEEVHEISKKDRYDLLKATNTDMSMISCLYIERNKELLKLMNKLSRNKPDIEFDSSDFDMHQRIWRITDSEIIGRITEIIKNLNLYITDGQTRYTTCLRYRNYMRDNNPGHTGKEAYNYTMVSLFDANSDGVAIMPEHRMVSVPRGFSEDLFVSLAQEHFKVEKIIVDAQDNKITTTMKEQIQTKRMETRLAVYSGGNYFYRLTLKDKQYIKKELLPEKSEHYCGVDTVVMENLILGDIFGIDDENDSDFVSTSISTTQCEEAIKNGDADVMIVLNPVKTEQIEAVTAENEKFPFRTLSIFPKPSVGSIIFVKED